MTEGTDFEDCSGGFCTERLLRDIYDVAGSGITKAALYKHYSSKQGILDKIVEQMNRMDYECDAEYEMPETEPDGFAEALKLCNKHGESQVTIDEIYPYHEREH